MNRVQFLSILFSTLFFAAGADAAIETKLIPDDGEEGDQFGYSVTIYDDFAAVGAWGDDNEAVNSGSVYIFKHEGDNWIQQAKLVAFEQGVGDFFGSSVAMYGDYLAVGAYKDDHMGQDAGAVYVFKYDGSTWIEQDKLLPADATGGEYFGYSVDMWEDYIVASAHLDSDNGLNSGAAYIFRRNADKWEQECKLLSDDGAAGDYFGRSVSLHGRHIMIGASGTDDDGESSGSVYVFENHADNWLQRAKLISPDAAARDYFGSAVSLSDDYAIIGAQGADERAYDAGAAYVYKTQGGWWMFAGKITAPDGAKSDGFGFDVSNYQDQVVISAVSDNDNGYSSGSVYVYNQDGFSHIQQAKLIAGNGAANDLFGYAVHLHKDYLIVGARYSDEYGTDSGAAYIYHLEPHPLINCISDVPHDQGGKVALKWNASYLDIGINAVFYSIWRTFSEPDLLAKYSTGRPGNVISDPTVGTVMLDGGHAWEWLSNQPAVGFETYSYTAATLYDSMSAIDGKHLFMVMAHQKNKEIYYKSNVDSGYSVDNLAPQPPVNLSATASDEIVTLLWAESAEFDFSHYNIYRNDQLYDRIIDNHYADLNVIPDQTYIYSVTAVDCHENESEHSATVTLTVTQVIGTSEIPAVFELKANFPNPFNPHTRIEYDLSESAEVRISVYDINGKFIRHLLHKHQHAGSYEIVWQPENLSSGTYLIRMQANGFTAVHKCLFLK